MLPAPAGLEAFQPAQRYLLIDHARRHGANENLVCALFDLIGARSDAAIKAVLVRVAERLQQADMAPVRDSVTRWIQLTLQRAFRMTKIPTGGDLEEINIMMHIQYERYEDLLEEEAIQRGDQQGFERGRQVGRQEGRQEAALQAARDFLQLLVTHELGVLPASAGGKITAADVDCIQGWIQQMVGGAAAVDVLDIPPGPAAPQ
ncbi:MAG: hypothetical protein ACEQSK_09000 [Sphingomonadaceae bacterium]